MKVELLNGKNLEERVKIVATAGLLSRFDGDVFELYANRDNYDKNLSVAKRIIGMGHESIIEHDYLVFGISGVSPIIEQILIGQRLASFTIKSRREVDFSSVGYYVPDFSYLSNGEEIKQKYLNHMNYLFSEYSKLVELGIKKEDARFVLPYCYHSNIVMGVDGRSLEKLISYCLSGKMSVLPEVRELGNKLMDIVKVYAPYLCDRLSNISFEYSDSYQFLDEHVGVSYDILPKVKLFDYSESPDFTIVISVLMNRYQLSYEQAILEYAKLDGKGLIKEIIGTVCTQKEQRELEQFNFKYQIPISLASLTHLTRHRMHSLLIPDFIPMWDLSKHIIPPSIKSTCLDVYEGVYLKNMEVYQEFVDAGVEVKDLVYFYLSGNMVNVVTSMNGRTLEWISRMRCCSKAQWEIRRITYDMVSLARQKAPLYGSYLGATCDVFGYCPEGKESCGKVKVLKEKK